jgi:hypothetical protein
LIKSILGIEEILFNKISKSEQSKYKLVIFLFFILIVLSVASGSYMAHMIYQNKYFSFPVGIFFGFIIFSIFKFSLSSIERDNSTVINERKVFNFSFIFKLMMLLIFGVFIAFPFSCFVQRGTTQNLIDQQKKIMLDNYTNSHVAYNKKSLNLFNDNIKNTSIQIDSLNTSKNQLKDSLKNKKGNFSDISLLIRIIEVDIKKSEIRVEKLTEKRDGLENSLIKKTEIDIIDFEKSLANSELPLFQLSKISTKPVGVFIIIIINLILIYTLYITTSLCFNDKYSYAKEQSMLYRSIIITEHKKNINSCKSILKEKFDYNYEFNSRFEDSPFNSTPLLVEELKVQFNGLENYFNGKSIIENEEV